jgi:hypothetical protein
MIGRTARLRVYPTLGAFWETSFAAHGTFEGDDMNEVVGFSDVSTALLHAFPALPRQPVGVGARFSAPIPVWGSLGMTEKNLRGDFRVAALRGDGGVVLEELTSRVHPGVSVANDGNVFTTNERRFESRSHYTVPLHSPFADVEFRGTHIQTPGRMPCTGPCRVEQSATIVATRGAQP